MKQKPKVLAFELTIEVQLIVVCNVSGCVCVGVTDIINGKVNSIMRLVLALAAHYKPNNVRETRRHSSLASYAQVRNLFSSIVEIGHIASCILFV